MTQMTIKDALTEFLLDHKARGSKDATIHWYDTKITMLLRPQLEQDITSLNVFVINRILSRDDLAPSSKANYDRALRGFCNWLHGIGALDRNPFQGRKRIKESFKPKNTLSGAEIQKLFRAAKLDKRFRYRNEAILRLFLDTGVRASEMARIKMGDINWQQGEIRIDGKTGFALLPISQSTIKSMRLYVSRERKGTDPHLFLYDNSPLTAESLGRWLHRLAKTAKIGRPIGCHLLRHTFATEYLRNGGDAFTLQRILRHQSPAMTQRYLHLATEDLRKSQKAFSPLVGLKLD